jgi:hypothetical protein
VLIPDGVARMLPKGPDLSREAAMVETVGVSDAPAEAGAGKTDGEPEQHRQAPATQTQDNGADAVAPRESEVADRAREIAEEYGTSEAPSSSSAPPKPGEPAGDPCPRPAAAGRGFFAVRGCGMSLVQGSCCGV